MGIESARPQPSGDALSANAGLGDGAGDGHDRAAALGDGDTRVAGAERRAALLADNPMWRDVLETTGINLVPGLQAIEHMLVETCMSEEPFVTRTSMHMAEAGGKRFRPALTLLAGHAMGAPLDPPHPDLVMAGVIIELTHMATLYHDDVIDGADARRGLMAAHVKWSNTIAILSGDWLLARASECSSDLGLRVTRIMSRTIAALAKGQIQEVLTSGDARTYLGEDAQPPTQARYMNAIYGKTASLIEAACQLGGVVSGMSDEGVEALGEFGRHVGLAFQIVDDIVDIETPSDASGKVQGTDIMEGVRTLPVLLALESLHGTPEGAQMEAWLNAPTHESVPRVLEVLQGSPYIAQAKDMAHGHAQAACEALDPLEGMGCDAHVLDCMRVIAMQAVERLA